MTVSQLNEGHGSTVSFDTGGTNAGLSLTVISIDMPGEEVDETVTDHLGVGTHSEKIAGSLKRWSDLTLQCVLKTDELPTVGGSDTITITAPVQDGESSAYSLSIPGFVKSASRGSLASNARTECTVVFAVNGDVTETPAT